MRPHHGAVAALSCDTFFASADARKSCCCCCCGDTAPGPTPLMPFGGSNLTSIATRTPNCSFLPLRNAASNSLPAVSRVAAVAALPAATAARVFRGGGPAPT